MEQPSDVSRLLTLPPDILHNIYLRVSDRADVSALLKTHPSIRTQLLDTEFTTTWLKGLDQGEIMRVWDHCVDRDGKTAAGEAVVGRRERQVAKLTDPTVLATYPQTNLAIALLWALERKNAWFVSTLSHLVPIHMSGSDALSLARCLYGDDRFLYEGYGLDLRLRVPPEGDGHGHGHETMTLLQGRLRNAGVSQGVVMDLWNTTFPPRHGHGHGHGPLEQGQGRDPITLILGSPRTLDSSSYRFVLGLRVHRATCAHAEQGGVMLGINPHEGSWDEMVTDGFQYGDSIDHFIHHLLDYPLTDMNLPDDSGVRPLHMVCTQEMLHTRVGLLMRLLDRQEIDLRLDGFQNGGGNTPLQSLASETDELLDVVFDRVLAHPSLADVNDFVAFKEAVRCVCRRRARGDVERLARVRSLVANHKSVTVELLWLALDQSELLELLIDDPHPHTPLTPDMITEALMVACKRGKVDACRVLLDGPVQLTARDIARVVGEFKAHRDYSMPTSNREDIREMLYTYECV